MLELWKIVHVTGALLTVGALTAAGAWAATGGTRRENPTRGLVAGTHGLGLLLLLVGGFGALARMGHGMPPGWAFAKLGIWLVLGGLIVLTGRKPQLGRLVWLLTLLLAATAASLAITKPF